MKGYQDLPEKTDLEPVEGFEPWAEPVKTPEYTRKGLGVIATEAGYVEAPELRTHTTSVNVDQEIL